MTVGLVGWRGMVGSVLVERMIEMGDFAHFEPHFFSTSNAGGEGPDVGKGSNPLLDAYDLKALSDMDVVIACQGGDYTHKVYDPLHSGGWRGYWIDAASALRMRDDSCIPLDPVNRTVIDEALERGIKVFAGGNCTVSLMLMGLSGLFRHDLVQWMSCMTYQAASGGGARHMRELIAQMTFLADQAGSLVGNPAVSALQIEKAVRDSFSMPTFPQQKFSAPLAGSAIPWIDRLVEEGQTREEWKGMVETNKILDLKPAVPIDGICVRIGALRCHASAVTLRLKKDVPLEDIAQIIKEGNPWVKLVDNNQEDTLKSLTPAAVSGSFDVPVGRLRKMNMGPDFLSAFTVGDQLYWGAAEPLRRMLAIIQGRL